MGHHLDRTDRIIRAGRRHAPMLTPVVVAATSVAVLDLLFGLLPSMATAVLVLVAGVGGLCLGLLVSFTRRAEAAMAAHINHVSVPVLGPLDTWFASRQPKPATGWWDAAPASQKLVVVAHVAQVLRTAEEFAKHARVRNGVVWLRSGRGHALLDLAGDETGLEADQLVDVAEAVASELSGHDLVALAAEVEQISRILDER
jgi:hypothetical protein